MHKDGSTQSGSNVGRATGQKPEFLVVRVGQLITQFFVETIHAPVRLAAAETRKQSLQPQMVFLVDHDPQSISGTNDQTRPAVRRLARFVARQLTRNQVPLVQNAPRKW